MEFRTQWKKEIFISQLLLLLKIQLQELVNKLFNLDEIPIADFKADDTVMDISADFTFEGIHLVQPFNDIQ